MRFPLLLVVLGAGAGIGAGARSAAADVLTATLGEPVTEVSHSVDISLDDGVATYKVQRVFANSGKRADEVGLQIELPPGAAATGLRIRARDRWYDGELIEREKAARMYYEMTGMGAYQPKDPALLQWLWADTLYLQVFPVLPGATSTVEYTLTVPTHYERGQIFLSYPRLAREAALATPIVTVRPAWGDATTRIVVDGTRVVAGAPVVLASPDPPAWLDKVGPDPAASHVASEISVPDVAATRARFKTVSLELDIDHTYRSDLRIQLMTPSGEVAQVFGGDGGDGNDVAGKFKVALPTATKGTGTWRLVVSDHVARDTGTVNQWSLVLGTGKTAYTARSVDTPVFVPDAPESANDAGLAPIIVAPPPIDVAVARLGKVVASDKHAFSRLEIDAAPQLKPLPRKAQVVFVVDASHSQSAAGIAAQLAIVRAYVAHVPDAAIEIVVYRRTATRAFNGFVPAAQLATRLAAAEKAGTFAPGNGSAIDAGATAAVKALVGRKGPRRIVMLTDELVRSSFTTAIGLAALARLPSGTIVHVVVPGVGDGGDEIKLIRDDGADLAGLASAHRGILARIAGLPARTDKPLIDAVLGLVRPIRIDDFAVAGLDLSGSDRSAPATLEEGDSVRAAIGLSRAKAANRVVLTGKIWGDRYRKEVKVDARFSRVSAALVFSEDDHHSLSQAEMMTVALLGKVVSPVTSYLATEPGVRPSPIGIPDRGTIGTGSMGTVGHGSGSGGGTLRTPPDLMALVAAGAKSCVTAHRPATGWSVKVDVETTRDEVVDVATTDKQPIAACLVEAVWAVRLTAAFDLDRESFTLAFR